MRFLNLTAIFIVSLGPQLVTAQTVGSGINSKRSPYIVITSQNITLSPEQVKIIYSFTNTANHEITETFVFTLPDKTEENFKQFNISIDHQPQNYKIMQRAISPSGHDISLQLKAWGLPYNPVAAMQTLDASENRASITSKLQALKLIDKHEEIPTWIVKTYYYCEYSFPPNSTTIIEQSYKPYVATTSIKISNLTALLKLPIKMAKQAINMATPWTIEDNSSANTLQNQFEKYNPEVKNYCLSSLDYQRLALAYQRSAPKNSQIEMKTLHFGSNADDLWASAISNFTLSIESPNNLYPVLCWHDELQRNNNALKFSAQNYVPLQDIRVMYIEN